MALSEEVLRSQLDISMFLYRTFKDSLRGKKPKMALQVFFGLLILLSRTFCPSEYYTGLVDCLQFSRIYYT